jgi:hypothetical protein
MDEKGFRAEELKEPGDIKGYKDILYRIKAQKEVEKTAKLWLDETTGAF